MKKLPIAVRCGAIAGLILAGGLSASAQSLVLQLQAANYNPATGVWTDTSGNGDNATYSGSAIPTLVAGVTPNGSAAVDFGNAGVMSLATAIPAGNYTAFAYIMPLDGGDHAIFGGTGYSAVEWRTYQGHQNVLNEWNAQIGGGSGTISSSGFNLIDMTVSPSGGVMNLNGVADGTTSGFTPTAPITFIGNNYGAGGGEAFAGDIAEVDIYNGVLSPTQISGIEENLMSEYVTTPEPTTWVMMAGGFGMLFAIRRFRRPQA